MPKQYIEIRGNKKQSHDNRHKGVIWCMILVRLPVTAGHKWPRLWSVSDTTLNAGCISIVFSPVSRYHYSVARQRGRVLEGAELHWVNGFIHRWCSFVYLVSNHRKRSVLNGCLSYRCIDERYKWGGKVWIIH